MSETTGGSIEHAIASEISQPAHLETLTQAADAGVLPYHEISGLNPTRHAIIDGVAHYGDAVTPITHEVYAHSARFVASATTPEATSHPIFVLSPYAGRFLMDSAQHLASHGYESAERFATLVAREDRMSIRGIGAAILGRYSNQHALARTNAAVHTIANNPQNNRITAEFHADRASVLLEQARQEYGTGMERAKQRASNQVLRIGTVTGLRPENIQRVQEQIEHIAIGPDDPILRLHNVVGYYKSNTLRIQTHIKQSHSLGNNTHIPVDELLFHEVVHGSSAQNETQFGLAALIDGTSHGSPANEAMATFLTEEISGLPASEKDISEHTERTFKPEFLALYNLWNDKPHYFAALYNAHYGQVDSTQLLAQALAAFHQLRQAHGGDSDWQQAI